MYTYFVNDVNGAYDHSCSNYGTMGVVAWRAGGRRGAAVVLDDGR